ncbi:MULTISPECIES: hypothetical protein [unclassified Streptomyces]|uniref:hypothetical protein n=1 Tax=unclassified Streptomyces TaxID=2593676 RepID=UPI00224D37E5|nr:MULTISPECIES: hypothetical protein [unclassified Streptomyces]WSP55895.1 hypothetical protein OG306_16985 [Streptomyces sp. NBC_01241]WSU23369.1 hypothetical protein OG508_22105 [Streptomyces sp. NBC_01108]MCX4787610.1 hypothetical protein [Streptomyces sp. NBC_01221]MCX4796605.1 hypothetical protein [Streptomyces sp. NBC_01242]WSP64241.1 hypothetical protein OG466_21935 [Streptomyces sp. NBC_01240]
MRFRKWDTQYFPAGELVRADEPIAGFDELEDHLLADHPRMRRIHGARTDSQERAGSSPVQRRWTRPRSPQPVHRAEGVAVRAAPFGLGGGDLSGQDGVRVGAAAAGDGCVGGAVELVGAVLRGGRGWTTRAVRVWW